ncbi:ParB/RepB/Spo0J family partition protein [Agreia sp. COWG]|uniref:ParB/RepB/Spo0J family partition protein n=1 Tax=Agreia sp. COWG TaxID=2773266 RepID=UPI0019258E68|nr:ParB/RepB/Spo0J family partition protein [Agreia sp. COWG]CAD6016214.1 ParB domain-containing protein [Agreia sp. COWG]
MAKATTPTTAAAENTAAPDLVAGLAAGTVTIEAVDPQKAQLDPNIRTNPDVPEWFVDSIRSEGVREPVLARRSEDGTVFVYDGQRRLLAAREAGTTQMLAVFGLADTAGTPAGRIMDQLRSFARTDLALSDRLAAYEQLTLDGFSVAKIAKSAGASKDDVAAAMKIAKSASARQAVTDGTESFDRLLLIAEFEGDENAIERVTWCDEDDLPFVAQRVRDDRAIVARRAEVVASYEEGDARVVTSWADVTRLHMLTDAAPDADDRPELTVDTHMACPGRTLYVAVNGLAEDDVRVLEGCSQPELHYSRWGTANARATEPAEELSEEEAAARAAAEAEANRQERRRLIANNKAWDTATTVRVNWLITLMNRKKLPTDAAAFVAVTLTRHAYEVINNGAHGAEKLIGIEGSYGNRDAMATLVEATPNKAGHVNLAVALAARENHTSRDSWRHPNTTDRDYLLQVEKWGHHLTAVERIAAGYPEPTDEAATTDDESVETDAE